LLLRKPVFGQTHFTSPQIQMTRTFAVTPR
jgi:hypothetical protein